MQKHVPICAGNGDTGCALLAGGRAEGDIGVGGGFEAMGTLEHQAGDAPLIRTDRCIVQVLSQELVDGEDTVVCCHCEWDLLPEGMDTGTE